MADQKKFEEGIKSYRTRIEHELESIRMNIPKLGDPSVAPSVNRIVTQYMRRSLDKINSYFHNIETLVEKEYAESAKSVSEDTLRVTVPGGEDIKT